jgi:hypothetical protein
MGWLSKKWKQIKGWFTPSEPKPQGINIEKKGTNQGVPIIYGFMKKSPCVKVLKVTTDKSGGAVNEYLHFICVFCVGEIEEIGQLYFNDIPEGQIDNERYFIETFVGSETQTYCTELAAEFSRWKSTAKLKNVAYAYVRLTQNKKIDWWRGEPSIAADIKGLKVLDPRDNQVKYSDNLALCTYDYLTNADYGKGLAVSKVNTQAFSDAANFIDTERTYTRTIYQTGFDDTYYTWSKFVVGTENETVIESLMSCNVSLDPEKTIKENVEILLGGMRAILPETNGQYRIAIEKDDAPVFAFTKDNLVGAIQCQGGSQSDRYNQVIIRFRNKLTGEDDEAVFPADDALHQVWKDEDNGKLLLGEFDFDTINNKAEALQMGHVIAHRSRELLGAMFSGIPETIVIEAGDIVTLPSQIFGWIAKPFRIESVDIDLETGEIGFQAVEHQNTIYPWAISEVIEEFADTSFALPHSIVAPTGLAYTEDTNAVRQGYISWDDSNNAIVTAYVLEIKYQGAVVLLQETTLTTLDITNVLIGTYTVNVYAKNALYISDATTISADVTAAPIGQTYTWIKYADTATGGGLSSSPTNKAYIGLAYNKQDNNPTSTPSDYVWVKVKGVDGIDGADGTNGLQGESGTQGIPGTNGTNGTNGTSTYFHIAYANDASGGGFSQSAMGKSYIGTYVNSIAADATSGSGLWNWQLVEGSQGPTGSQGLAGNNGDNGQTSYLHIAYATSSNGASGFSATVSAGKTYIGQYTDFNVNDSGSYSAYSWTLIKGTNGSNGSNGTNGTNGTSTYFHIAYANDASGGGFSQSATGKSYIGTYVNSIAADATSGSGLWNWQLVEGSQGPTGSQGLAGNNGDNGQTSYLHIAYATSSNGASGFSTTVSAGKTYIGQYTDFNVNDSGSYSAYSWTLIKGTNGSNGTNGTNGLQGESGTQGIPGTNGTNGTNGTSTYFHIAYANDASGGGFSQSATGKSYIGTYVNSIAADATSGSGLWNWQLVEGSQGPTGSQGLAGNNGDNGQTSYLHIAYATSSNGASGFSTTVSAGKTYIGQYTDFNVNDSGSYSAYSWTLIKGTNGSNGANGATGSTGAKGNTGNTGAKGNTGNTGATGTAGARGSKEFFGTTTGTSWNHTTANNIASGAGYAKVDRDVVTIYNTAGGFAETRYWNGTTWVTIAAVVNGNLLVKETVSAEALAADSVQAKHLSVSTSGNELGNNSGAKISLDPYSSSPLSITNETTGEVAFSVNLVDGEPKATVNGNAGQNFISDAKSITSEVKKSINPYYLGNGGSASAGAAASMLSGAAKTLASIATSGLAEISFSFFKSNTSYSGTIDPEWRVRVYRNSVTGTPIFDRTYKGNHYNYSYFGMNVASISIDDGFVDDAAPSTEVYVIYITQAAGTLSSLTRNYFSAYSPSFLVNQASKSVNGWSKDKDTGIITQWGTVAVTATSVTFPIQFPNACLNIDVGLKDTTYSGSFAPVHISSKLWTQNGFTFSYAYNLGGSKTWRAKGY